MVSKYNLGNRVTFTFADEGIDFNVFPNSPEGKKFGLVEGSPVGTNPFGANGTYVVFVRI